MSRSNTNNYWQLARTRPALRIGQTAAGESQGAANLGPMLPALSVPNLGELSRGSDPLVRRSASKEGVGRP